MSGLLPPGSLARNADGRAVLRHAPDSRHLREQIGRNEDRNCEVTGCGHHRHKLSSLCRQHYRTAERTGHPTASTVKRGAWRPWVVASAAFVSQQLRLDHVGISEGVSWCAKELLGNQVVSRRAEPRRPHTGYSVALSQLRTAGVGPDDMLARWIAAQAFLQWDGEGARRNRVFKSDEHFRHQAAKLYLHPAPLGAPKWAQGHSEDDRGPVGRSKLGTLVRRFTFERTNRALGVLALRAGAEVNARLSRSSANGTLPEAERIGSDLAPFHQP